MTIPRIPGAFDALGQGLGLGLNTYIDQKQQQVDRANAGARLILGLVQAGQIDPSVISDPTFQQTLATAKIPAPPPSAVVPSVPAERARRVAKQAQGVEVGSPEESVLFDIPDVGTGVSELQLRKGLLGVKNAALSNPAVARIMADVLPAGVAENRERAMAAAAAPKEYDFAAENFVAQAGLALPKTPTGQLDFQQLASNAKALAAADPQYRDLVANGQLSDEYFARAARGWQRLTEEDRIKYADIAARRLAAEKEARYYYDAQRKSYDTEVAQLQADIKQNALSDLDKLFLTGIQTKIQKGQPLDASEQAIMEKVQKVEAASARIEQLTGEREDLRDRFIGRLNPIKTGEKITPPSGAEAAARRGQHALDPRLQSAVDLLKSGQATSEQLKSAKTYTDAEKQAILKAAGKQ